MPLTQFYYPAGNGLILSRGDEDLGDGTHRVLEEFVVKFLRNSTNNPVGRLMGPKGATMKWLRQIHSNVKINVETNLIRFQKTDGKFTVESTGPLHLARSRVRDALREILPLLNEKDPRNFTLAEFQIHCEGAVLSGAPVEWRLSNFRSSPAGMVNDISTYYIEGLRNQMTFASETFPACMPGFDVGVVLDNGWLPVPNQNAGQVFPNPPAPFFPNQPAPFFPNQPAPFFPQPAPSFFPLTAPLRGISPYRNLAPVTGLRSDNAAFLGASGAGQAHYQGPAVFRQARFATPFQQFGPERAGFQGRRHNVSCVGRFH